MLQKDAGRDRSSPSVWCLNLSLVPWNDGDASQDNIQCEISACCDMALGGEQAKELV